MRQHSCHRAAAWSAAGALADGNGWRAGRSWARRAGAGAIRRLPRCTAPSTSNWYTHGTRPCLAAAPPPAPVAAQVAGTRAAGSKTLAPTVEESPGYSEPGEGRHRQPAPKLARGASASLALLPPKSPRCLSSAVPPASDDVWGGERLPGR
eukprot:scaffold88596_cov30-Phaeocystis_antarctica.AAC.1